HPSRQPWFGHCLFLQSATNIADSADHELHDQLHRHHLAGPARYIRATKHGQNRVAVELAASNQSDRRDAAVAYIDVSTRLPRCNKVFPADLGVGPTSVPRADRRVTEKQVVDYAEHPL